MVVYFSQITLPLQFCLLLVQFDLVCVFKMIFKVLITFLLALSMALSDGKLIFVVLVWTWNSNILFLFFADAPRLMQFNKLIDLPKGSQFILLCNSYNGLSPFRFSFFKDSHPLHQSDRLTVDSKDSFSQLIIKKLSEDDSGNFSCTVENSFGSDHQWTVLSVKGLPSECLIFVQNVALGR